LRSQEWKLGKQYGGSKALLVVNVNVLEVVRHFFRLNWTPKLQGQERKTTRWKFNGLA
jgi:hypothetical protein